MKLTDFADQVRRYTETSGDKGRPFGVGVPGLTVVQYDHPTTLECVVYTPAVCLILGGRKEATIGDRSLSYGSGESLVVSHDLPVVSRVTEASPETPYIGVIVSLDLGVLRSLYSDVEKAELPSRQGLSIDTGGADAALVEAVSRYFNLVGRPVELEVLAPLILKEIRFRTLMAPHGAMMRNLLRRDSHASRISRALGHVRQHFRTTLAVADLANIAGMSVSSFHEHFKSVTATTPLQYQKDLRLMEARRLFAEGAHSVSVVAFEVGYDSPTQFSREYSRRFGASPRADLIAKGRSMANSES